MYSAPSCGYVEDKHTDHYGVSAAAKGFVLPDLRQHLQEHDTAA